MIPVHPTALQKVTADISSARRCCMCGKVRYTRCSKIPKVRRDNMLYANEPLPWAGQPQQIVVIDQDLGQSGASAVDREGFQRLVAEVGLGRVGLVMGLEVSRLARSSLDWHHLLEMCAMTGSLILDEDGLYDPATFNDRLLLGLKGTMSEAELHVLRARLRGGILNKASRAALKLPLPIGPGLRRR